MGLTRGVLLTVAIVIVVAIALAIHLYGPNLGAFFMEARFDMLKQIAFFALITVASVTASAQEKKVTVADFAGTWNIEVMSHQIALVIEPKEANTVTATMMVMGNDVPLKGELVDKTIKLVGIPGQTTESGHVQARPAGQGGQAITVTLQDDGTIAGEMMMHDGPVKWTGEKLRTRKKG